MEIRDKVAIYGASIATLGVIIALFSFFFGPGLINKFMPDKQFIAVDFSVEDGFTAITDEDVSVKSMTLYADVLYSNIGHTTASINSAFLMIKDSTKSENCKADLPDINILVKMPEGQSTFTNSGKIQAGDIERALYKFPLLEMDKSYHYPEKALFCLTIDGIDVKSKRNQVTIMLGNFSFQPNQPYVVTENPEYKRSTRTDRRGPYHLLYQQ